MTKWLELLKSNDFIAIKKYIKDGANVNAVNENGESVLMFALKYRCDDDIIDLLLTNNADIKHTSMEGVSAFDMAIAFDHIDLVKKLVEDGIFDINQTSRKSGFTPLMCAVCYNRENLVKYFLEKGVNKDTLDEKGLSAKDYARKLRKKAILNLL